ncbi:adenosine receptor A2b-like [Asterias amurensis]|uniref:adenosine receptor A2b-like n=1 Tax=Asterias amurensis TaxID=7602 RepID=UPI003AB6E8BB
MEWNLIISPTNDTLHYEYLNEVSTTRQSLYVTPLFMTEPAPIVVVVFTVALETLMVPFILIGNGAVVMLVTKNDVLRTTTNSFMVSLATADALQGLTLVPVIAATLDPSFLNNEFACLTLWCMLLLASGCSSLSLLLVTVDRYIKILHPLTYQQIVNTTRASLTISSVWIYTFVIAVILPFSGWNQIRISPSFSCLDFTGVFNSIHLQILLMTNGIFPFVVMCLIYMRLFSVVLQKLKRDGTNLNGHRRFMKRELRSVKTFLILLGFTGLAWLPVTTIVLLEIHTKYKASLGLRSVLSWLTFMNSAANPVVYSLRSEPFQRAINNTNLYRFFKRCCKCRKSPRIEPSSYNTYNVSKTLRK